MYISECNFEGQIFVKSAGSLSRHGLHYIAATLIVFKVSVTIVSCYHLALNT
jgi:hypothetical protein